MTDVVVVPEPGMIITRNTTFKPGEYDFSSGRGIVIASSDIVVDGNGAVFKGKGISGEIHSYSGVGIYASGCSRVTVKGLTLSGFRTGMKVLNGEAWIIIDNDFSYNYTDPDFGWGDGQPLGALMLEFVQRSEIRNNKGNYIWNGLHLFESNDNTLNLVLITIDFCAMILLMVVTACSYAR